MTANPTPADGRHGSSDDAEALRTDKTDASGSRPPSPVASVDWERAPDVAERPVREQLKNTSITAPDSVPSVADPAHPDDALSEAGSVVTDPAKSDKDAETSASRGRPRRKRSFEELAGDQADERTATSASKHLRKRSREGDDTDLMGEVSHQSPARDESPAKKVKTPTSDPPAQDEPERPSTPPPAPASTVSPPDDMAISPQNKRTRDQFVKDHDASPEKTAVEGHPQEAPTKTEATSASSTTSRATADEPESKRPRDGTLPPPNDKEAGVTTKIPPSSAFSNTSAQSPFGALASSKSPSLLPQTSSSGFSNTAAQSPFGALGSPKSPQLQPQTSSSAFATSGFASFAGSSQSPFGTFGAAAPADGKGEKSENAKLDAAPSSGFGALGGGLQSPFASVAPSALGSQSSGFAKLSNGFAAAGGFGGAPLSSFAKPGSSGIIGSTSKASKPIGASVEPEDEADGESNEEAPENGEPGPPPAEEDSKDTRFYEQDLETGEEGEETIFSNRAKLYVSQEKQWKERGVGTFKVNIAYGQDENSDAPPKKSARFIMRADGSHRIVLNSPIKKQITIEDPTGGPPRGKTAIFLGFIDDKPTMMQLKMRSNVQTEELHSVVTTLQGTL